MIFYSVSTIAALGLDIYVRRQQTRRGIYRLQDMDGKAGEGTFPAETGNERRESKVWDAPRLSMDPYGEPSESSVQLQGYSVPENQFDYDTGYGGHQPERAG